MLYVFTIILFCDDFISPFLGIAEWHPIKNGHLKPTDVTMGSGKKVWWLGKCGHEWEAFISNRNKGRGCPYCSHNIVLSEISDLQTLNPTLASEWHPIKNGRLVPRDVTVKSNKKIWRLRKCGHEWEATINNRNKGNGCPKCRGLK